MKGFQLYTPSNIKKSILILLYEISALVFEIVIWTVIIRYCAQVLKPNYETLSNTQSFRLVIIILGKNVYKVVYLKKLKETR